MRTPCYGQRPPPVRCKRFSRGKEHGSADNASVFQLICRRIRLFLSPSPLPALPAPLFLNVGSRPHRVLQGPEHRRAHPAFSKLKYCFVTMACQLRQYLRAVVAGNCPCNTARLLFVIMHQVRELERRRRPRRNRRRCCALPRAFSMIFLFSCFSCC